MSYLDYFIDDMHLIMSEEFLLHDGIITATP